MKKLLIKIAGADDGQKGWYNVYQITPLFGHPKFLASRFTYDNKFIEGKEIDLSGFNQITIVNRQFMLHTNSYQITVDNCTINKNGTIDNHIKLIWCFAENLEVELEDIKEDDFDKIIEL